ncbi:hypothetical protein [Methanolobus bombayensis]|uniref:hypothetical protein n=1 Tax=Methanolobus bombayensis TaxID=38023 RepID=UPI001AE64D57|nr:hypothetical protein [Methanolobus bombayensis]MBP1909331.1 uncharacterized protein YbaR (Trm112 family) [Methanolobus bombayensis]
MSEVNVFRIKENMDIDDDGSTVVACPECEAEIKVLYSNIADDSMALVEFMECPVCHINLGQVHPSEALNKKIADHVAKELLNGLELDLSNALSKR